MTGKQSLLPENLSTAWIDYRKAFDSVPHTWILKVLQMYKTSPTTINFLTTSMKEWKTNLYLNPSQGSTVCENIKLECGIFGVNSLSPLYSCLVLVPLFYELNNAGYGYNIYGEKTNHLFYMDDLKLYGNNDYVLDGLLRTVMTFSDDIRMAFGLDKCAKAKYTSSTELDTDKKIKELDQEETYKYLSKEEVDGIQHGEMKEKIRKEC